MTETRAFVPEEKALTVRESDLLRMPFKEAKRLLIDAFENVYLHALVRRHGKNLSRASRGAVLSRRQLRNLLRKHGYWPPISAAAPPA